MVGIIDLQVIGAVLLAVLLVLIARRLMQGRSILYPYRIGAAVRKSDMKIYIDIDGTLIHEELGPNFGKPAAGLADFIRALRPYDTYWLTTHCMEGDPSRAGAIVKAVVPEELHADIDRIKPAVWETHKAEAIDFDSDFLWFENDPFPEDLIALTEHNAAHSLISVNLRNNPDHLIKLTHDVL